MRRRFAADFLLGASIGRCPRSFPAPDDENISPDRDNTITHLCTKLNLMLFSRPSPLLTDGLHLVAKGLDEMRGIRRKRRASLDGDIGVEARRFGNLKKPDAGNAAMRHRELVDDGDAESRLHQRTDRVAE